MITAYSSEISRKAYNVGIEITLGMVQGAIDGDLQHLTLISRVCYCRKTHRPKQLFRRTYMMAFVAFIYSTFRFISAHHCTSARATKILPLLLKSVNS